LAKANLYYFIHYPSAKAGGNDKDNENSNVKSNIKAGGNEKTLAKAKEYLTGWNNLPGQDIIRTRCFLISELAGRWLLRRY